MLFRKRADNELIALFPDEPGDPEGKMAVAFAVAGKHQPVNPELVVKNSKPAKEAEYAMLKGMLSADPYGYELEVIAKVPANSAEMRASKKDEYARFKRLKHLY